MDKDQKEKSMQFGYSKKGGQVRKNPTIKNAPNSKVYLGCREMNIAEFFRLSQNEKKGIILIKAPKRN